jgi:hypothetical protein
MPPTIPIAVDELKAVHQETFVEKLIFLLEFEDLVHGQVEGLPEGKRRARGSGRSVPARSS